MAIECFAIRAVGQRIPCVRSSVVPPVKGKFLPCSRLEFMRISNVSMAIRHRGGGVQGMVERPVLKAGSLPPPLLVPPRKSSRWYNPQCGVVRFGKFVGSDMAKKSVVDCY